MQRSVYIIVPIVALLLGFGISQYVKNQPVKKSSTAVAEADADVDATTIDGEKIKWSAFEGQWLIFNFFAEWCAPCLREIPELNDFYVEKPQNTHLYMVSFDPLSADKLEIIKSKYGIQAPILLNKKGLALPVSFPQALPATVFVSPDGEAVKTLYGEVTKNQLDAFFTAL